ncbi:hypothetical protein [Maribacter sp. 2307ULW6-5]|uniref:hypothetical protein n=1 Tax=Maribacter sp. 2307ULW6-5 TaxID=3386275 RepID=UPI0039BCCBAE
MIPEEEHCPKSAVLGRFLHQNGGNALFFGRVVPILTARNMKQWLFVVPFREIVQQKKEPLFFQLKMQWAMHWA